MKKIFYSILFSSLLLTALSAQNTFKIAGGNVNVTGDAKIVLNDAHWVNDGTFSAGQGTVIVTGDAASSEATIGGSSENNFYNLHINKTTNGAQLAGPIAVSNDLNMENGNLDLQSHDLSLPMGATISNAGTNSYIETTGTGRLAQWVGVDTGAKDYPVGNTSCTPLNIQNAGTTDVYYVRTTNEVLDGGTTGTAYTTEVVNRTWFVEEEVAGNSDLTLTATWNVTDELTDFDRVNCYISHYDGGWDFSTAAAAAGADPYSVSRSGITSLSPFSVRSSAPLPLEWLSFKAYPVNNIVQLDWQTAFEKDVEHFEVEHSADGQDFKAFTQVTAKGNLAAHQDYQAQHLQPIVGANYYRLKQVDATGKFSYSPIQIVHFEATPVWIGEVYPNPTADWANILINTPTDEKVLIQIFDVNGRLVRQHQQMAMAGNNALYFDFTDLAKGSYWVKMKLEGQVFSRKVVVQ